jgi:transcriptional regulator with XRE-family HTH domain
MRFRVFVRCRHAGFWDRMPDFSDRLKAERSRLRLSQAAMAEAGGVGLNSQSNYENGHRSPDAAYLERVAAIGVDVMYLLTGIRASAGAVPSGVGSEGAASDEHAVMRAVTREEAALLDNYEAADERGRAAARSVLDALAQPKAANG